MRTFLLSLLLLCLIGARVWADDWPMARHDPRNTGFTAQEVRPPLRLAWQVTLGKPSYGTKSLLASGGAVCAVGGDNLLLYSSSGKWFWQIPRAMPLYLKDDLLVVAALVGERGLEIRGYRWASRELLWTYAREDLQNTPPGAVAQNGLLYLSLYYHRRVEGSPSPLYTEGPELLALDLQTGAERARRDYPEGWAQGPPAVDEDHAYWGLSHWLHVLRRSDLQPQWAYAEGGNATPMLTGTEVITQGWAHEVTAFDLLSKRLLWRRPVWRGAAHCLAQGRDGAMVLVEADPIPLRIVGLKPETGEMLWQYPLIEGYGDNPPAAGSGHYVYVPGHHLNLPGQKKMVRGGLYAIDARTGKLVWKYERPELDALGAIIADGAVYATDGSALYKFVPVR